MIIRKPYAFLIKNFKKIHIVLLILSLFVAYKLVDITGFVNDFMNFGIYDAYNNPITKHITIWLSLALIIIVIGTAALIFLLRYKGKPWKIYLVPLIEYFALFIVMRMIKGFFTGYTTNIETTDLRMSRDLLTIFLLAQVPAIGIFIMRVFGLDIKKFNFNSDSEFLELSEEDREEFEVSLDIDKNSFKRFYRKAIRNVEYFYLEHKLVCRVLLGILVVIIGYNSYKYFFITNKAYKEGDLYYANGYTIKINDSYFTNKDYHGKVISDKSNFVVVNITIKNNSAPRVVNFENFHLKNGTYDYTTTHKTYSKEFQDLGKAYDNAKELKRDESDNYIIIYKVNKELNKNRFVLFFQEDNGPLRKIKLNLKDVSKIEKAKQYKLEQDMKINVKTKPDTVSFDYYDIDKVFEYTTLDCKLKNCSQELYELNAEEDYQILKIEFASEAYNAKNMIDFLTNYGKIIYKDSNGEKHDVDIENLVEQKQYGKIVFLAVPNEITTAQSIELDFTVRNERLIYKLL